MAGLSPCLSFRIDVYTKDIALSIKDPETDRLARKLAETTGESLTEAIRVALADLPTTCSTTTTGSPVIARGVVLDRSAIIAMLCQEPAALALADALERMRPRLVSAGTVLECALVLQQRHGPNADLLTGLPMRWPSRVVCRCWISGRISPAPT